MTENHRFYIREHLVRFVISLRIFFCLRKRERKRTKELEYCVHFFMMQMMICLNDFGINICFNTFLCVTRNANCFVFYQNIKKSIAAFQRS